jgi:FtsH-binding integral membrane protein
MKHSPTHRLQDHTSYPVHRKQVWVQIMLPVLLAVLVLLAVSYLLIISTFRENGDVGRWAAISTIWLFLPVLGAGLIVLILFAAIIYLVSYVTGLIPAYTYQAQRFVYRINGIATRIDEMARKPALLVQQISKLVRAYLTSRM